MYDGICILIHHRDLVTIYIWKSYGTGSMIQKLYYYSCFVSRPFTGRTSGKGYAVLYNSSDKNTYVFLCGSYPRSQL